MLSNTTLSANKINITIDNIDEKKGGKITVFVFTDDAFPKVHDKAIYSKSKMVHKQKEEFNLDIDEKIEELAIKIHHDENSDGKVTKNWTGIYPKEGLGFSNKQKINLLGPPVYKKSKLTKKQFLKNITISIVYP